jgi:hypothetical protein
MIQLWTRAILLTLISTRAALPERNREYVSDIRPVLMEYCGECHKKTWHIAHVAYFLEKMKSLDEGGTSLLHNSQILFGTTIRDGNKHDIKNLPVLPSGQGGGTIRTGRRLRAEPDTPLCSLHLALLHRMGVMKDSHANSTGVLHGLS